jgi:hypothetical protein
LGLRQQALVAAERGPSPSPASEEVRKPAYPLPRKGRGLQSLLTLKLRFPLFQKRPATFPRIIGAASNPLPLGLGQ